MLRSALEQPHPDMGEWRAEIRTWLEANVHHASRDVGDGRARRAWERLLFDAGYGAIHWPTEYGGRGADLAARLVFQEEYERAQAPERLNLEGLMLAGPTIMQYGTAQQKERWLTPLLRAEEVWCQGFSEPEAGSDLASLRTHAQIEGDTLLVNGQKIWTSHAEMADWMFALVRTGTPESRHRGITWLMIDLATPGVEVRPIRQINGDREFSEVFFTDVRVPASNVIGGIDGGWKVAMTALGFERGPGRRTYVKYLHALDQLRQFARIRGVESDPAHQEVAGGLLAEVLRYRYYVERVVAESADGAVSPAAAYNKLYWSEMQTRIYEAGLHVLGPAGEGSDPDGPITDLNSWQSTYWFSRATRIYAGSNQIQRDIIAERLLGLPRGDR